MELSSVKLDSRGNPYHGDDSGCYVEFSNIPQKDEEKSLEEGRPIYRDMDFITIQFAGDKTRKVVRPVIKEDTQIQPSDLTRWPRQWAAYQAQELQVQDGTPIIEWAPITKSQALELKAMNIHTVEALASITDANLNWFGARSLRDQAHAWVTKATSNADLGKLVKEKDELANQVEALQLQVKQLAAALDESKSNKPKGNAQVGKNVS